MADLKNLISYILSHRSVAAYLSASVALFALMAAIFFQQESHFDSVIRETRKSLTEVKATIKATADRQETVREDQFAALAGEVEDRLISYKRHLDFVSNRRDKVMSLLAEEVGVPPEAIAKIMAAPEPVADK